MIISETILPIARATDASAPEKASMIFVPLKKPPVYTIATTQDTISTITGKTRSMTRPFAAFASSSAGALP